MSKLFVFVLVFVAFVALSQENEVSREPVIHPMTKEPFQVGVFLTFDEFIQNKPNRGYTLNVDEKLNMERRSAREKLKGLPVKDDFGNEVYLNDGQLMGYFDGQFVYVSLKKGLFRIEDFGTAYCVFSNDYNASSSYAVTSSGSYSMGAATGASYDYLLDMRTGEIHSLNRKVLSKIVLPELPDLLNKFEQDKMKGVMMRWYVTEFNRLYAGEPEE